MYSRHKGIIFLLLSSFLFHLVVIFVAVGFREHPDILRWKDWGRIAFLYGFADTYVPTHLSFGTFANNMPPGTLYVVSCMYWLWLQAGKLLAVFGIAPGSNPWVNVVLLQWFLRLPSLVADLGLGLLIYLFVRGQTKKVHSGLVASALFLYNPAVLYNSAFWGQMDAVNNFFGVLAIWFLVQKKYVASAIALTSSLLVKFSLLFSVPFFVLVSLLQSKSKGKTALLVMLAVVLTVVLLVLPISRNPLAWYWQYTNTNAMGEMTNVTAFAFNIWWLVFHPTLMFGPSNDITQVVSIWLSGSPLTEKLYGGISLGTMTLILSCIIQLPVYWWTWKKLRSKRRINAMVPVGGFAAIAMLSYLSLPHMHERYLYPAFAPLAILVGMGLPVRREFIILSFFNFVNLLIVWHPMPLPLWLFEVMRQSSLQWWTALCTVFVGLWTTWKIMRRVK